jgi:hypothetical protein
MTRLMRPPFATLLDLLLYGPEIAWHRALVRKLREGAARRLTSMASQSHCEEAVKPWLVSFDGGYAFPTDAYQARLPAVC